MHSVHTIPFAMCCMPDGNSERANFGLRGFPEVCASKRKRRVFPPNFLVRNRYIFGNYITSLADFNLCEGAYHLSIRCPLISGKCRTRFNYTVFAPGFAHAFMPFSSTAKT